MKAKDILEHFLSRADRIKRVRTFDTIMGDPGEKFDRKERA